MLTLKVTETVRLSPHRRVPLVAASASNQRAVLNHQAGGLPDTPPAPRRAATTPYRPVARRATFRWWASRRA